MPATHAPTPHGYPGELQDGPYIFKLDNIYPSVAKSAAPDYTPGNVASYYVQALDALKRKHHDAAGAMCRKAVDVATKCLDSSLGGKLATRIEKLAGSHRITPDLKDWAHAIRLDGNDAVHEEDPFTPDQAKDICSFTELFLMYVFTLPGMLKERKEKKQPT